MGIPATESEIFGSSYSASLYISQMLSLPSDKRTVFALGESGMETELRSVGLQVIGGTDPSLRRDMTPEDFTSIASGTALDPSVGCVLAGLDFHVNYLKLALAGAYIQRGAHFLATNTDTTLPMNGKLFPGAGSVGAPLAKMSGKEPLAFGKPSQAMMDAIEGGVKFERERACMVGDRLDTDIRFGNEGRLGGTLLVLTGVSKMGEWGADKGMRPSYVADKLGDLCG
jgi:4-nitrophenyl phosphatase